MVISNPRHTKYLDFTKQYGHKIYVIMETMCPPCYHHNSFVATHALGYMMDGYILLVPKSQGVLTKLNKERHVGGHK